MLTHKKFAVSLALPQVPAPSVLGTQGLGDNLMKRPVSEVKP